MLKRLDGGAVDFAPLGEKFVRKYMRQAEALARDNRACLARQIGAVLVKAYDNGQSRVLGNGYNGPPAKTPHCDSRVYLDEVVWPQLTEGEKRFALGQVRVERREAGLTLDDWADDSSDRVKKDNFVRHYAGCGRCPRRLVGAASGTRLEVCSCEHGERNALHNAVEDLHGAWMFCWCPVACWDCAKAIVQRGVARVFFVEDDSYGAAYRLDASRFLFSHAGVKAHIAPPEYYLEPQ